MAARGKASSKTAAKQAPVMERELADIMEESMAVYAKDVILSRAIPDARDGMKPVQRHILWVLDQSKLTSCARHCKTNTVVGNVMPYHAHGDASIKTAVDNLSQEWVLNVPLVDMQGNNGGIDGAPPAAGRYTEVRQSAAAGLMLERVDTGASVMVPNYDGTRSEPEVLPAAFPLVLANGAFGIAEGISCAVMPHNPIELVDVCIKLVQTPNARTATLLGLCPGPDFPTGGALVNAGAAAAEEMERGTGRFTVRGTAKVVRPKNDYPYIEITELPWNPWGFGGRSIVTIPSLIESMDSALEPIRGIGITEIRDDSDEVAGTISVKVMFRKNVDTESMDSALALLYEKSLLQVTMTCSDMMISKGHPVVLGIAECCRRFVEFRLETLANTWRYDIDKEQQALELVRADIIAFSDPDGLMKITRLAKDKADMVARLQKKYKMTERQATHIAEMPLHRFNNAAKLCTKKKEEETERVAEVVRLNNLLNDEAAACAELLRDLRHTRNVLAKAGYTRKTKLVEETVVASPKKAAAKKSKLIVDKQVAVWVSEKGMARVGSVAYGNQTAAGKDTSVVASVADVSTRDWAYGVMNNGQAVGVRVDTLETANLDANLEPLSKTVRKLNPAGKFVGVACVNEKLAGCGAHLVMVTRSGYVKAIDSSVVMKDASRAKEGFVASSCHGLRAKDDEIVLARLFTDEEMKMWRISADVSWDGKTKRITAHRDIALSKYVSMKHGLAGSGRHDIKANGGVIDKVVFEKVSE